MLFGKEARDDLVIRGARVVDPVERVDAVLDVRVDAARSRRSARRSTRTSIASSTARPRARAGVRRPARPPALARPRGRGDDRLGDGGRRGGRLLRDPRDPEHGPGRRLGDGARRARRRGRAEAEVPVGFMAAITKGQDGGELTEMGALADAGAAAFSDDGRPVVSAGLMRRALQYGAVAGRPLAVHCEEPTLTRGGQMHEGEVVCGARARRLAVRRREPDGRARPRPRRVRGASAAPDAPFRRRVGRGAAARPRRRRRGERRGDAAPSLPHRRRRPDARPEPEDEPAAACRRRPRRPDRRAPRRHDRRGRNRSRAARARGEGRPVRGGAVRRHRARDRVRGALHAARPVGCPLARAAARADVGRPGRDLRARPAAGRRRRDDANLVLLDLDAEWTVDEDGFRSRSANSWLLGARLRGQVAATVAAGRLPSRRDGSWSSRTAPSSTAPRPARAASPSARPSSRPP